MALLAATHWRRDGPLARLPALRMRIPALATFLYLIATGCQSAAPPEPPVPVRLSPQEPTAPAAAAGHKAGDVVVEARAFFGLPILQKSLYWDGNGEVENYGIGGRGLYFLGDNIALGAGLNGILFKTADKDTLAVEFESLGRGYLWNGETFRLFWDFAGGWEQANHRVPEGGTHWNMTFSFGPGCEIPIGDHRNLIIGGRYHHMSNALGRQNDRNPSMNEGRIFVGLGWEF